MRSFITCTFSKNTIRVVKSIIIITLNAIGINSLYIYNNSLYTGIFSGRLKIAVVKPLSKKGDKTITTN